MSRRLRNAHGSARWRLLVVAREAGMSTAEYAVGTLAACAFAAVLMAVIKSGGISELVTNVITTVLSALL